MIEVTNPAELRKKLKEKLDYISNDKGHLIIHRLGEKEDILMMPLSEYNSWKETHYLLSTEANRDHLNESLKEAKKGELHSLDLNDLWK